MSLQKNRIRGVKNVIFSLLRILVDRPMGGNPPTLRTPLYVRVSENKATMVFAANKILESWFRRSSIFY